MFFFEPCRSVIKEPALKVHSPGSWLIKNLSLRFTPRGEGGGIQLTLHPSLSLSSSLTPSLFLIYFFIFIFSRGPPSEQPEKFRLTRLVPVMPVKVLSHHTVRASPVSFLHSLIFFKPTKTRINSRAVRLMLLSFFHSPR